MKPQIITFLILIFAQLWLPQFAKGQGMGWEWAQGFAIKNSVYIGGAGAFVSSNSILNDVQGNLLLVGGFNDSITIGGVKLTGKGPYIYKFDSSGAAIWAKATSSNGSGGNGSITIDGNGNIYVIGSFSTSSITFDGITLNNTSSNHSDFFISKYDPSGNLVWAKSGGGSSDDYASGIAVDVIGNVYVVGSFYSATITFGTDVFTNAGTGTSGTSDSYLTKYDVNGNIVWAKQIGGSGKEGANVAISSTGDIYVTGFYYSPSINIGSIMLSNSGGADIFIAKYNAAGNVIWAKKAGSSNDDYAIAVLPDELGNIYISGNFYSPSISFGSITLTNSSTGNYDVFLAKYDANGNVIWAQKSIGSGYEYLLGIAKDIGGGIVLTGIFGSFASFGNFTLYNRTTDGTADIFIAKFTSSGNVAFASSAGGIETDYSYEISVDLSGNTYIKGDFFSPSIAFGEDTVINPAGTTEYLAKLAVGAATPAFLPDGGTYLTPAEVTISCPTSGATIHYTTNGIDPTESDPVVSSGSTVTIGAGITQLKARAFKSGKVPSEVKTSVYQVGERVVCGNSHSLAIRSDSSLWAWGKNSNGQLGDGTINQKTVPVQLTAISGVGDAAGGLSHSVALKGNGTVWTWGLNGDGQLGNGNTNQQTAPAQLSGIGTVVNVAAGYNHTLAINSDGTVLAWGKNSNGQLGNQSTTGSLVPVAVYGLNDVADIAAGESFSLALKNDGTIWSWGYNGYGQLGIGNSTPKDTPVQVSTLSGVIAIAAGRNHALALKSDGTVWTWGSNSEGQLGNGKVIPGTNVTAPMKVLYGCIAVAAGADHSLAVGSDGKVLAWGYNGQGQLGNNSFTGSSVPAAVIALAGINSISAGTHSMAVTPIDNVHLFWAWGSNSNGQLGDESSTNRSFRVLVKFPVDENGNGASDYLDYNLLNNINSLTDADLDGLANWKEMMVYGTDPNTFDMNKDGLADGVNIFTGLSAVSNDTDGDGIPNIQEIKEGTSPVMYDTDGDGVSDAEDSFPIDPKKQMLPLPNLSDHTPPVITILEPQ